jgi:hypothetical protein
MKSHNTCNASCYKPNKLLFHISLFTPHWHSGSITPYCSHNSVVTRQPCTTSTQPPSWLYTHYKLRKSWTIACQWNRSSPNTYDDLRIRTWRQGDESSRISSSIPVHLILLMYIRLSSTRPDLTSRISVAYSKYASIDSSPVPSHTDYVQCAEEAVHCFRTRLTDTSTNLPYTIRCASPTHDHRIRNDIMQVAQITFVPITQYTHFICINSVHLVLLYQQSSVANVSQTPQLIRQHITLQDASLYHAFSTYCP